MKKLLNMLKKDENTLSIGRLCAVLFGGALCVGLAAGPFVVSLCGGLGGSWFAFGAFGVYRPQ